MPALGFALLLTAVGPAAPPSAPLPGPQLARGDELHYVGQVVETGDRVDNRFKKTSDLEVRVFVLEVGRGYTDCAVQTLVRPADDPLVAQARQVASGPDGGKRRAAPAVRLDLVRVDARGHAVLLTPAPGPPPVPLGEKTPTAAVPPPPVDAPPVVELGLFVPLPVGAVTVGGTWDTADANRPPVAWAVRDGAVWNGRRCVEVSAAQQTDGYDRPDQVRHGWRRTDTLTVAPADGFAATVRRTIARREGRDTVGTVSLTYELKPVQRRAGAKYTETRAEAEAAWAFAATHADLATRKARPEQVRARQAEVEQYLADRPGGSGFRPAVEGVRRRYEAAGAGTAPPVVSRKVVITPVDDPGPTVGRPAPDFVAADVTKISGQVRLTSGGKPTVLVFFKPGSQTSADTLAVAEALHRKYAGGVTVIPLAVFGPAADAATQRATLRYTVPVYDGTAARAAYQVGSVPQFFVVDGLGTLRWAFDAGVGPEVGYLVKQEVDKVRR